MRFLTTNDYNTVINMTYLMEVIDNDENILKAVEQKAQAEMTSYLVQRYDVNSIFTNTQQFDLGTSYPANQLVEYTEDAYSTTTSYVLNDRVVYQGGIYKSLSASTGVLPTTGITSWAYVTKDKTLYTSISATTSNYPDNTSYFELGDSVRPPLIVGYLMDMVLYHIHARTSTRFCPEYIWVRYSGGQANPIGSAIWWLNQVSSGELTAGIAEITPAQGNSIRWGSNVKFNNFY